MVVAAIVFVLLISFLTGSHLGWIIWMGWKEASKAWIRIENKKGEERKTAHDFKLHTVEMAVVFVLSLFILSLIIILNK